MVYPANAFDSRLRCDSVPLGSSPTKSQRRIISNILAIAKCLLKKIIFLVQEEVILSALFDAGVGVCVCSLIACVCACLCVHTRVCMHVRA